MNGKFSGSAFQDVPSNPPNLAGMHPPTPAQFDRDMHPPQQPLNSAPTTPIPYYENGTLVPYEGGNDSAPITHGQRVTVFPQYPRGPIEELILTLKHYIGVQNRHHENHIVFTPLLYNLASGLAVGTAVLPQQGIAPDFGTFYAQALMIDNPSGYTFFIQEINRYIPPQVYGYIIPCFPAVQRLTMAVIGGAQTTPVTMIVIPREEPMYDPSAFGAGPVAALVNGSAGLATIAVASPNGTAQTATGAAGATTSIVLPAVAGQRNHLKSISLNFSATTTAAATLSVLDGATTVWSQGYNTGFGALQVEKFYFGENGIANVNVNTSMTIQCTSGGAAIQSQVSATDWVG